MTTKNGRNEADVAERSYPRGARTIGITGQIENCRRRAKRPPHEICTQIYVVPKRFTRYVCTRWGESAYAPRVRFYDFSLFRGGHQVRTNPFVNFDSDDYRWQAEATSRAPSRRRFSSLARDCLTSVETPFTVRRVRALMIIHTVYDYFPFHPVCVCVRGSNSNHNNHNHYDNPNIDRPRKRDVNRYVYIMCNVEVNEHIHTYTIDRRCVRSFVQTHTHTQIHTGKYLCVCYNIRFRTHTHGVTRHYVTNGLTEKLRRIDRIE